MQIEFFLKEGAKLPTKGTEDSAGWDIYSCEDVTLLPNIAILVKTGLQSAIPTGYFAKLFDRSGNALKRNLMITAGVIDADYRNEWGVVMVNCNQYLVQIEKGDRIAQAVFFKVLPVELISVDKELPPTKRMGGFGSTGK